MTPKETQELNERAHILAYDYASGVIESASYEPADGWIEIVGEEENYEDELRYLEMRGLLVRNTDNPLLLKILPVEEATA